LDNLKYFAEPYRLDPEMIEKRIKEMLEVVGLAGREKDRVETYSSGMQQRLHLARAMLHDSEMTCHSPKATSLRESDIQEKVDNSVYLRSSYETMSNSVHRSR